MNYGTWVGAESVANPWELHFALAARDAAFKASEVASDTGSLTFKSHAAYAKAWKANRLAFKAWEKAGSEAKKVLALPFGGTSSIDQAKATATQWVTDAGDRMGELDVAYKALKDDYVANVQFRFPPPASGPESALLPPELAQLAEKPAVKWGLIAAGVAAASKALGWW